MKQPSPKLKSRKEKPRYLEFAILNLALNRMKMAFVSGPRQVGKTTLAKTLTHQFQNSCYENWDNQQFRLKWTKGDYTSLLEKLNINESAKTKLLILDEIHKSKSWKNKLKGFFDEFNQQISILVTGSARLNIYKRGSDSLLGRYYNFRLHPFSLGELLNLKNLTPDEFEKSLFRPAMKIRSKITEKKLLSHMNQLYQFSGFPETLFTKDKKIHHLWKKSRLEKIVREDLIDLSKVQEVSTVLSLCSLLPERVGSTLSVQSLREILEVSHDSVTRWLTWLRELYYIFEIKPYAKSISRSLKKEPKIYFYDWTDCSNEGAKFENFIASHLLKSCHYWEDTGEGEFNLHYLRDKEKNEVDFLVVKNKKPWFTVESKLHDQSLGKSYLKFQGQLGCPHIHVVSTSGIFRKINSNTWIMSADYFCSYLI